MKLAIFGGTGRTGRHLVEQALAAGHEVAALARDPGRLPQGEGVRAVRGDVADAAAVAATLAGADAALVALGHSKGVAKDVLTVGTRRVVEAMRQAGVRRLVVLTGAGVRAAGDPPSPGAALMRALVRRLAPALHRDAEAQFALVRRSGLDWVVVRVPRMVAGPRTGRYRNGLLRLGPGASISRADAADAMLRAATEDTYLRQAPMASG